jgi:DNA modification methylase
MEYRKVSELKELSGNPRTIDTKQFDILVKSIEANKDYFEARPLILSDRTGQLIVLGGNQRLKAAKKLKLKEVPTYLLKDLTEEREKEIIIRDNVNNGIWDWDILANEWEAADLEKWGLDVPGFVEEPEAEEDDFAVPEGGIETDIVLGDLFEIGEHRLLCGDSTDSDQVAKLMNGQKADMVFTDPPYNLQERGQTKRTNKTESKREDFGDWDVKFNPLDVIPNIFLFTAENANIYICTSSYLFGEIHNELEQMGLKPNYVVWCKNNPMPSLAKNRFVQATELIIHAIKGKPTFNYPKGENLPNYFNGNVEPHEFGHPTQKPIYVVEHFINKENGSILDLFMGSGTTMVASHQLKRKCYGMELDPKYCQVIVDRMLKLDPNLVIKRNGEVYLKSDENQTNNGVSA